MEEPAVYMDGRLSCFYRNPPECETPGVLNGIIMELLNVFKMIVFQMVNNGIVCKGYE